jgi:hypothetical protein
MRDPLEPHDGPTTTLLLLTATMGPAAAAAEAAAQDKAGQRHLVNSNRLPADLAGREADHRTIGLILGPVDPRDPLFRTVTLPAGWTRRASDHDLWSHLVDQHGRRRIAMYYRAATGHRAAHATIQSVDAYVAECAYAGTIPVADPAWATRQAIITAARTALQTLDNLDNLGAPRSDARDRYTAILTTYTLE